MILFPNCKINIGLDILRKRPDGYHDIETVMYPLLGLYDGLEIIRSEKRAESLKAAGMPKRARKTETEKAAEEAEPVGTAGKSCLEMTGGAIFTTSGLHSGCPAEENLVVRAYELVRKEYGIGSVKIHLHKNIPLGAGLGGGSSDAAFTVLALNSLFGLGLSGGQMETLGARLGSDVPFFIRNSAQLCSGKGEIMAPANISFKGKYIAIITPDIHISTAEAYRGTTPLKADIPLNSRIASPIEKWRETVYNAFEKTVFADHPEIELLKTSLYSHGAVYASMTGTGSAVYGIFNEQPRCISTTYSNSFVFRL